VAIVPVRELDRVEERRELRREGGGTWRGWWYVVGDVTIWGATGSMLHELLQVLRREAVWSTSTP
jgi:hypothetical protein